MWWCNSWLGALKEEDGGNGNSGHRGDEQSLTGGSSPGAILLEV